MYRVFQKSSLPPQKKIFFLNIFTSVKSLKLQELYFSAEQHNISYAYHFTVYTEGMPTRGETVALHVIITSRLSFSFIFVQVYKVLTLENN